MTEGSPPIPALVQVPSPMVLPPAASSYAVVAAADADWGSLEVPADLQGAIPRRQREFLAGRYCAARALEALAPGATTVGRGPERQPLWPAGIIGSVTHTGAFAAAAVARTADLRALGIDTERVERFETLARMSRLVMLPGEAGIGGAALEDRLRLPLVFSAKEAIFKCLYPLVGRPFYFKSAILTQVDVDGGTFEARLTTTLAEGIDPGLCLEGKFEFAAGYVHTGVWLRTTQG